ncbi:unnamed protein product [Microthlaspi erraticum]|uniref:Secreted protein n=1 Tax=Microthlaspi erraticum TaxID=1685480 RepID=A0A6D2JZK0_9BRAS|nr:unnamed protein product [Microthlaspi erraticum]
MQHWSRWLMINRRSVLMMMVMMLVSARSFKRRMSAVGRERMWHDAWLGLGKPGRGDRVGSVSGSQSGCWCCDSSPKIEIKAVEQQLDQGLESSWNRVPSSIEFRVELK